MEERPKRSADASAHAADGAAAGHRRVPAHHGPVRRRPEVVAPGRRAGPGRRTSACSCRRSATPRSTTPTAEEINSVGTVATHRAAPEAAERQRQAPGRGDRAGPRARDRAAHEDGYFWVVVQGDRARGRVDAPSCTELDRRAWRPCSSAGSSSRPGVPYETMLSTVRIADPGRLADTIAAHLPVAVDEKQGLLETTSAQERLVEIARLLDAEIEKLRVDKKIHNRVKKQMEKAQKEYYLNEKIKAIQQELGRQATIAVNEIEEFRQKIEDAKMPVEAKEKALQELKRFEVMPPVSAEATVSRNYLEWLLAVPWSKKSRELNDIQPRRECPRRGSLRPGQGQGADPRVPRRASAREQDEGLDPVLRRPARRGQDVARAVDRPGHGPQVRPAVAWAACATRPRSAAIVGPTSGRSPVRSSR